MRFDDDKAIYLQITEYVMEKILRIEWPPEQKILSVRDLGVELEVNPNTVMRAYDLLQQQGIIYNKRGLGFFVSPDAVAVIRDIRKKHFLEVELPRFFNSIDLLGISMDEVNEYYKKCK